MPVDTPFSEYDEYDDPDYPALIEPDPTSLLPATRPLDEPLFRFIGGPAGTGKTFLMRAEVEKYDDALLCATTGIAAINLGGCTINSLLWYGNTDQLRMNYELGKLHAALKRIADSRYRRIIVDEVSMMDGNQLDILVCAFDDLNKSRAERELPPLGLTLVADFCQLSPVNAPFVFERPSWSRFAENVTLLTKPRRQSDAAFLEALQAVRRGDAQTAINYFAPRLSTISAGRFDGTTIFAKNDEVDRHNHLRLMELDGPTTSYPNTRNGEQLSEWKHIPENLHLKPGALVMILVNKRESVEGEDPMHWPMIYANGDLAHFKEAVTGPVFTETNGKMEETGKRMLGAYVTLVRNGETVYVGYHTKQKTKATGHAGVKAPREEVQGEITYLPLRLAWATTVHKSQGLSLDKVQVNFSNHFFTQPGMLYVAMSRARTPEGLHLVGTVPQLITRCRVDPKVRDWL